MPRALPLYCHYERDQHGKIRIYFRKGKGKRTLIVSQPATPEFAAEYAQCLAGLKATTKPTKSAQGTLQWLIDRYRETMAYRGLSPATRRQRDNIFKNIMAKSGHQPFVAIDRATIVKARDKRSDTPAQARNFLDAMRGLYRWALEADIVQQDPTHGVTNPKRPKTDGFPEWNADEIEQYRAHWPLGTRQRVWLEVLIGCCARRGDAVQLGRQHVKNGLVSFKTEKTGDWAYVPVLPSMIEAIEAGPVGDLTFIIGVTGHNLTKETFGNFFRAACNEAGILNRSAHGVRKYSATVYAEMGLSEAELEAIFGWRRGSNMPAHYSRNANRKLMASQVAERIENKKAPNLDGKSPNLKSSH